MHILSLIYNKVLPTLKILSVVLAATMSVIFFIIIDIV